ncbi:MAG: OmpA family protein [Desulfovibrio sp.]|nr:OmpA family protein [Desulfovibrio sp.]MCA1987292.1 OmpA family protein [Desulfovibrio sp.]
MFRHVAALQLPATTAVPDVANEQSSRRAEESPLEELQRLAGTRGLYATQIAEISASLEAIQTEQAALQARAEALRPQQAIAAEVRRQLTALDQERRTLQASLQEQEEDILEQEHLVAEARKALAAVRTAREREGVAGKALEKLKAQLDADVRRQAELETSLATKEAALVSLDETITALLKTEEESARAESSLGGLGGPGGLAATQGQAVSPELETLRKNIAQARKAAAAALAQKRAAREQTEKTRDGLLAQRQEVAAAVDARRQEFEALQQELAALRQTLAGPQAAVTKEQLAALEAPLAKLRQQRQIVMDKLAAVDDATRGLDQTLATAEEAKAELAEIESAMEEAALQISRFTRDRATYHSKLSSLDARSHALQDEIRQVLTAAESSLFGLDEAANATRPQRILVSTFGEGAFAPGQATLQEGVRAQVVKALAQVSAQRQAHRVSVEGHTDDAPLNGNIKDAYGDNINLSYHRAKAVADALVAAGLEPSAIVVAAHGAGKPVHPNDTQEGRSRNRRVEVWLVAQ